MMESSFLLSQIMTGPRGNGFNLKQGGSTASSWLKGQEVQLHLELDKFLPA